jgi:hypothetical protein
VVPPVDLASIFIIAGLRPAVDGIDAIGFAKAGLGQAHRSVRVVESSPIGDERDGG